MANNIDTKNISVTHIGSSNIEFSNSTTNIVIDTIKKLEKNRSLHLPLSETIKLLHELSDFKLGRFLLHNKSLNGYWTSYVFRNKAEQPQHPLEKWLLNESLLVFARERFQRFKALMQDFIKSNMHLASIPCGVMDDLLQLDYSTAENIKITGIDLDKESLELAKQNAKENNLSKLSNFIQKDAWNLDMLDKYDLIASNGLNMYVSNRDSLINLYKNFYKALRAKGKLFISFLTPPPTGKEAESSWKKLGVAIENLKKERAIFEDIIGVKFLNFCTEDDMRDQLTTAGFKIHSINYNDRGMLPIAIAYK